MSNKLNLYKSLQSKGLIPSHLNYHHYSIDQLENIANESIANKLKRKTKTRLLQSKLPEIIRSTKYQYHKLMHHTPILIYQPGQVGSGSLYISLKEFHSPVYHVHRLNPLNNSVPYPKQNRKIHHDYIGKRYVQIIVLVRNPINRNLSNFWFHYVEPDKDYSINKLSKMFIELTLHDIVINWIENEFIPVTGFNIYGYQWPTKGYMWREYRNQSILIIKTELPNLVKEAVISNFIEKPFKFTIQRNIKTDPRYEEFKKNVILPDWYVEKMIKSKYYRYFYK